MSSRKNKMFKKSSKWKNQCIFCYRQFYQSSHLNNHLYTHTLERPYYCQQCDNCFYTKNKLWNHYRTHLILKPFMCLFCNKGFKLREYLISHIQSHTNEKPYHCNICGSSFSDSSNLARHLFTHQTIKPFECLFCRKTFVTRRDCFHHVNTHTRETPYDCKHCGKSFTYSTSRAIHMRTVHSTFSGLQRSAKWKRDIPIKLENSNSKNSTRGDDNKNFVSEERKSNKQSNYIKIDDSSRYEVIQIPECTIKLERCDKLLTGTINHNMTTDKKKKNSNSNNKTNYNVKGEPEIIYRYKCTQCKQAFDDIPLLKMHYIKIHKVLEKRNSSGRGSAK